METTIYEPFLTSTKNLFQQMFSIEAQALEHYVHDHTMPHRWEISGILAITGEARGVIAIRLPRLTIDKLLRKSGIDFESEDEHEETVNALVGELINIIGGNAISTFAHRSLDISVPVIVQGENHRISWPKIAPVIGLPFRSTMGEFEVQVCFKDE